MALMIEAQVVRVLGWCCRADDEVVRPKTTERYNDERPRGFQRSAHEAFRDTSKLTREAETQPDDELNRARLGRVVLASLVSLGGRW